MLVRPNASSKGRTSDRFRLLLFLGVSQPCILLSAAPRLHHPIRGPCPFLILLPLLLRAHPCPAPSMSPSCLCGPIHSLTITIRLSRCGRLDPSISSLFYPRNLLSTPVLFLDEFFSNVRRFFSPSAIFLHLCSCLEPSRESLFPPVFPWLLSFFPQCGFRCIQFRLVIPCPPSLCHASLSPLLLTFLSSG